MQNDNGHCGAAQVGQHGAEFRPRRRQTRSLPHQHPARQTGGQQEDRPGVAVARQANGAKLPQHGQQHKRGSGQPGAVQRFDVAAGGAAQHGPQVEQAVTAGRNAKPPDVPPGQTTAPSHPEQHAGDKPLGNQCITAAQQLLQQKFHDSVQNRNLEQRLDEPQRPAQLGAAVKHAPVRRAADDVFQRCGRGDDIAGQRQNALIPG